MSRNNLALPDFPSYSKLQNKLEMRVKNNMQHQRKGLSLALLLSSSLICCTTIKCSNPIGTKAQRVINGTFYKKVLFIFSIIVPWLAKVIINVMLLLWQKLHSSRDSLITFEPTEPLWKQSYLWPQGIISEDDYYWHFSFYKHGTFW